MTAMFVPAHKLRARATQEGKSWYCTCGRWRVNRDTDGAPWPAAAQQMHGNHVRAVQLADKR